MKGLFLHIIFSLLCLSTQAQKVSNIRAEQRGQDIVVLYSLETTSPCEVSLLLSQDNGVTWGSPLKNVSGDVGKNIAAGEKQINWKVLEEREELVGDKIRFKLTSYIYSRIVECSNVEYIGNKLQLDDWCFQEFKCPHAIYNSMEKEGKTGLYTITVEFDIDYHGKAYNFKVFKNLNEGIELNNEALRVCEKIFPATRWKSGICRELGNLTTSEEQVNLHGYYDIQFVILPK